MPTYAYACGCGHGYEEFRPMSAPQPAACPACGEPYGGGFNQDFGLGRQVGIVYGNPTTFGQQAELNAKRLGKEQMQKLADADRARLRGGFTGKLPAGASVPQGRGPWG